MNFERARRELSELREQYEERVQDVPPSREVLEQRVVARDEAYQALGEALEAAEAEGRQVIDPDQVDHRTGPERDLLALVVDDKVKAACRHLFDIGMCVSDPSIPRNRHLPELNDRVHKFFHSLIWDERGVPWTGPMSHLREKRP